MITTSKRTGKQMNPIADIEKGLRQAVFRKSGNTWHKRIQNKLVWVINFQKGKGASKEIFSLTVNVGIYVEGTFELIFEGNPGTYREPDSFFRTRPRFYNSPTDWWDFGADEKQNNTNRLLLETLVFEKVLPFLERHDSISSLISYLPVEKWKSNTNFHGDLLRLAAAYFIFNDFSSARILLHRIVDANAGWHLKAKHILDKMENHEKG